MSWYYRSRETPKGPLNSYQHHAHGRVLAAPVPRRVSMLVTIGDALDAVTPPKRVCASRGAIFDEERGRIRIRQAELCGKVSCPRCVLPALEEKFGQAWASWWDESEADAQANVLHIERDDGSASTVQRRVAEGVQVSSTAGAFWVTDNAFGRLVFWPGSGLCGDDLHRTYREALRAVNLVETVGWSRERSDDYRTLPPVANDVIVAVAESLGMCAAYAGKGRPVTIADATARGWSQLVTILRDGDA